MGFSHSWTLNFITKLSRFEKPFVTGMFMLVEKKEFEKLGKFDESAMHCEDYLLSKKFKPSSFGILKQKGWTDDRRFRKQGYFGMVFTVMKNFLNRKNDSYFYKDVNYWK